MRDFDSNQSTLNFLSIRILSCFVKVSASADRIGVTRQNVRVEPFQAIVIYVTLNVRSQI